MRANLEKDESALKGYFDCNATTPLSSLVANAMAASLSLFANASSNSSIAMKSKQSLLCARQEIAQLIGANANQICFTSGGSESNNWAINVFLLIYSQLCYII